MVSFQIAVGATAVQFSRFDFMPQNMTVYNAGPLTTINVGDVTVGTTLNGIQNGIPLLPGASYTFQLGQDYSARVNEFWAIGSGAGGTLNVILV
jgi:hypothetical protein